jgi:hypothetical protein
VLDDVLDGYADIETVREAYGVAIDRASMTVDTEETRKLRAARNKTAKRGKQPASQRARNKGAAADRAARTPPMMAGAETRET